MPLITDQTIVVRPGQIRAGDLVHSPESGRTFEVENISPVMIPYWNLTVPVYWIKGTDTQSGSKNKPLTVQTVCLPRSPWNVFSRREVPDPS